MQFNLTLNQKLVQWYALFVCGSFKYLIWTSLMLYLMQFVFFTGGIVFLTLIFNGSTTQFLLHMLGMDKLSATKVSFINCHLPIPAWRLRCCLFYEPPYLLLYPFVLSLQLITSEVVKAMFYVLPTCRLA
jgi:hypothetical protein